MGATRISNPSSGVYNRLYGAGVTRAQIAAAINSGLDPLQMPPEYFGLTGGYTPNPVGPGASPVYEWGVDVPTGASGPLTNEIPGGLPFQPYVPFTDFPTGFGGPNAGPLNDVTSGSYTGPGLSDVTGGSGPTVSSSGVTGSPGGPGDYDPFDAGSPSLGGTDIRDFGGDLSLGGPLPSVNNYYDAGNGITYVYDENWNYIGTQNNPASAPPVEVTGQPTSSTQPDQGHTPIRTMGQGGRGSYPGGTNINFGSVGLGPSGAIGQGPDSVYGQNYGGTVSNGSASTNSAAAAFNMMIGLEGLGGGGPSINARYQ